MRRTAAVLCLIPLVLTGCNDSKKDNGSTTPPSSQSTSQPTSAATTSAAAQAASTPDPCALLTTAEISAAMGVTVLEGKASDASAPLGGKRCYWPTGTASTPISYFEITVRTSADVTNGMATSDVYDNAVAGFTAADGLAAVSGVGDKAEIGKTMSFVLKGDVELNGTIGLPTANAATALTDLTKAATAKLP